MFPGSINSIEIKKVSELWKDEKKYRIWIIGFAISLFILFSLYLSVAILFYIFKDGLLKHFTEVYANSPLLKNPIEYFRSFAITLIFITIILFFSLLYFSYSVFNSYKIKSFEKLETISSFFLGLQVFYLFFNLILQFVSGFQGVFGNNITILVFVLPFLIIPVWLLLSREIKKIKRMFFIAKRQEEIKAFYEENGYQEKTNYYTPFNSPFSFPFKKNKKTQLPYLKNSIDLISDPELQKKTQRKSKLHLMTISQLRRLADKLSISGNKDMKKPELINIILMVSQSLTSDIVNKKKHKINDKKN